MSTPRKRSLRSPPKVSSRKPRPSEMEADGALYEITRVLRVCDRLSTAAAKALALRLEQIHYAVQVDSDLMETSHSLVELDVLDGVRMYLHTHHGTTYRTDTEIAAKPPKKPT